MSFGADMSRAIEAPQAWAGGSESSNNESASDSNPKRTRHYLECIVIGRQNFEEVYSQLRLR
jgi:hypothetical protein